MNTLRLSALLAMAFLGGLIGGLLSNQVLKLAPALAAEKDLAADTIIAKHFLLADASGRMRGYFDTLPDGNGSPIFSLNDKQGKARVHLSLLSNDSPNLVMYGEAGQEAIHISAFDKGGGFLEMRDENGQERLQIGVGARARPGETKMIPSITFIGPGTLSLLHQEGAPGILLSLGEQGEPTLGLIGKGDDRAGLSLQVAKNRTPSLNLADSKGKARITMAVGTGGSPIMWFFDEKGSQEVTLGGSNEKVPGPMLVLTNVGQGFGKGGIALFDKEKLISKIP